MGSLKSNFQVLLKRIGLYHRLKASRLYDVYWSFADSKLVEGMSRELEFYHRTLQGLKENDLIFDIGANLGHKTRLFLKLGARVIAVEPDKTNQEILKEKYHSLRLRRKPVTIVGKAVSDKTGFETMYIDEPGSAKNTLSSKWADTLRHDSNRFGENLAFRESHTVETITMEDLFKAHGRPFYIKIDVEGHEANVLSGMRSAVPVVSFEVNLPEFLPEALVCVQSLERIATGGLYNCAADCEQGLSFQTWLPHDKFVDAVQRCVDPCIEIFWRAPISALPKIPN